MSDDTVSEPLRWTLPLLVFALLCVLLLFADRIAYYARACHTVVRRGRGDYQGFC
jgi:hypothetical protein